MKLRNLVPILLGTAALAACSGGDGSPTGGNASTGGRTPGGSLGNLTGAIFTSDVTCTGTDENIYNSKSEVYANGGPQGGGAAGLPDGYYYVKVTSPEGQLLGTTVGSANERPVHVTGGKFDQCYQLVAILIQASDGQPGYDDTPNAGGEYKLWISSSRDFDNNESKTDNFKVLPQAPPPPVMPVVQVTKTATSYYERVWAWSIDKNGSTGTLTLAPTQTGTVSYSVVVTNTGTSDRGFKVSGNITVANTGTVPATVNGVADVDDFGAADLVSCGTLPRTLAVGETMSCTYTQAITGAAFGTAYTNTGTASVAKPGGGADLTFAGGAQFSFDGASPNLRVDECVTVNDSWSGTGSPANAQVCAGQSPATWTYSRTFGPSHITECGTTVNFGNTATVKGTETNGSDSWNVAVSYVCGCTPGYWKNNTGGWPIATSTTEGSVFGPTAQYVLSNKSLGLYTFPQGLAFQGNSTAEGGAEILLRAASAAYLNAKKFGYAWTWAAVQTATNNALASNDRAQMIALATQLDAYNNAGCPLNAKGAAINP